MIYLKELINLNESAFDRGLFKAIFFSGIPGSGKSYTLNKVKSGFVDPKIINTDKFIEYFSNITNLDVNVSPYYDYFKSKIHISTKKQLSLYINSMLPLFIDGTSNKIDTLFRRDGILKSFGYDTGMVWINTDLETAYKRAEQRTTRHVPREFIKQVNDNLTNNIPYYKNHFGFFMEIKNSEGELTDDAILKSFKAIEHFFNEPIINPLGIKNFEIAKKSSGYLTPRVYVDTNHIEKILNGWYNS